jgi:hypothetical protein
MPSMERRATIANATLTGLFRVALCAMSEIAGSGSLRSHPGSGFRPDGYEAFPAGH